MNNFTAKSRILHTMIRVFDIDKSIDFYTQQLGMQLLRRTDNEHGRFTLAFVGYGDEETNSLDKDGQEWAAYINYVTGPISIGYGMGDVQDNTALVNGESYVHYGVSFAVNDNLSISYGRDDVDVETTGSTTVTEETTGIGASYTMGSASVRLLNAETDNVGGNKANTAVEHTEISLLLAF